MNNLLICLHCSIFYAKKLIIVGRRTKNTIATTKLVIRKTARESSNFLRNLKKEHLYVSYSEIERSERDEREKKRRTPLRVRIERSSFYIYI